MVNTIRIMLYSVLPILLGGSLLWIFYRQGKKYNRYTPHFIVSLLFLLLSSSLLSLDMLLTGLLFSGGFFSTIALIFGSLSLYAYFRHYFAMNSSSKLIYEIYNYVTIITISLHIPQLLLIIDHPDNAVTLYVVQTTARFILYFLVGAYAIFTAYQNYLLKESGPTKIELLANCLLLVSLTLVSIGNYGFILDTNFTNLLQLIQAVGTFFGTLTLVVLVGNYIKHPRYIMSIPIPIQAILIYNSGGIPVYSKLMEESNKLKVNDYLISNAFSAISTLMSEALGEKGDLKHIDLGMYQVFFGTMGNDNKLCIIASGNSYFFKKSIEDFLRSVSPSVIEKLDKKVTDDRIIPEIDRLISQSFPYLD